MKRILLGAAVVASMLTGTLAASAEETRYQHVATVPGTLSALEGAAICHEFELESGFVRYARNAQAQRVTLVYCSAER